MRAHNQNPTLAHRTIVSAVSEPETIQIYFVWQLFTAVEIKLRPVLLTSKYNCLE